MVQILVAGALLTFGLELRLYAGPPAQPVAIDVSYSQGEVTLTWSGGGAYLQSAYEITGPWFPIPGATSPYTTPATASQQFFRLNYGPISISSLPVAVNDSYTVLFGQTAAIAAPGVLGNDSDPLGLPITPILASPATYGVVSLESDGSFYYTPPPFFVGVDSFSYVDTDGTNVSQAATVTLNVTESAPVAVNDAYGVHENLTLVVPGPGVLANDYSPDSVPLQALTPQISGPNNGALSLNLDGSFSYMPNPGFTGSDSFTYEATDQVANSSPATVTLEVHAANARPTAVGGSYSTSHDQPLYVSAPGALTGATDPDGDPVTAVLITGTTNGTVSLFADGSFQYIPNAGFTGPDSFVFAANDGVVDSGSATILISVTNAVPVANDDAYSTLPGQTLNIAASGVLLNDTDAENDPLTAQLETGPGNGTLTLNADGSFTYAPSPGFIGVDTFSYLAYDGFAYSDPATVTITVTNIPPVAVGDAYGVHENLTLTVAAPGVLANDYSPSGAPLSVGGLVNTPTQGVLILNSDGSFAYTPGANYAGQDSFSYYCTAGGSNSQPATVSLSVHGVNSPPIAAGIGFAIDPNDTLEPSGPFTTSPLESVLMLDTDADNDPLTAELVSGPANAQSFTLNPDGTFIYQPNAGFTGTDSFTYAASDGVAVSAPATVSLFVNYTTLTVDHSQYSTHFNTPLTVPAPGVFNNVGVSDTSPVDVSATLFSDAAYGTVNFQTNGGFTYQPPNNFVGKDEFAFEATDGVSNLAPATVTITCTDTAPVANPATYYVATNGSLTVGANGVLSNDFDPDGDAISASLATGPSYGTLSFNTNGSFVYTPLANFIGVDQFTYTVSDGALESPPATVTIIVTNLPVVQPEVYFYTPGVQLNISAANGVLQGDFDPTGTGLSASLVSGGGGLVTLSSNGSFIFASPATPPPSNAPIYFQYKAVAGDLLASAPETVALIPETIGEAIGGAIAGAVEGLAAATPPALIQVSFTGGTDVIIDDSGAAKTKFAAPQWLNKSGSGVIDPKAGDRANPYCYVQGTKPTISATFDVANPVLAPLPAITVTGTLYNKDAANPLGITVSGKAMKNPAGQFVLGPTVGSAAFGASVAKLDPLLIQWTFTTPGGAQVKCGQSKNPVYIVLAAPVDPGDNMFQTALEIGCVQGTGAKMNSDILGAGGNIWKYFEKCKIQRTDGTILTYYYDWATMNCKLYELLKANAAGKCDAQCATFASLFRAVLRCQGVNNTIARMTGLRPKKAAATVAGFKPYDSFLVKSWTTSAGVLNVNEYKVKKDISPRVPGYGMRKYDFDTAEITYTESPGQNNDKSAANFNCHFIIEVTPTVGAAPTYFDPSYGKTYAGPADAEGKSIVAYLLDVKLTATEWEYHARPVPATAPDNLEFYFPGF